MKLERSVCAGVMAALVSFSAGAEQPAPESPPSTLVEVSQQAPAPQAPVQQAPAQDTPVQQAPVQQAPAQEASVQQAPVAQAPVQQQAPVVQAPVQEVVAQRAPEQETRVPVSLSLLPGLSNNGFSSGNVVNNLSIGIIATHAGRVDGLAVAMAGNWVVREMSGAELALGANYAGQVKGAQMAVGLNVAGGAMHGWQAAVGANVAAGEMVGAQFSSGVNIAAGKARGLQAATGLNIAPDMVGVQASSGLNLARRLEGAQLSLLNVGGDVSGAQVGILNIARRMKGLQIGLVNVAGEADGLNLGLLNFVGNGQHHVQVWVSDMAMTNVALKLGGKYFHTLFTVGLRPSRDNQERLWAAGLGLGAHIPAGLLFIDVDALASGMHEGRFIDSNNHLLAQLRLVAGFQPFKHFALFGGVTANTLVSFDGQELKGMDRFGEGQVFHSDDARVQVWPGLVAGIQI
jgi:hypothetical protein